MKKLFILVLFIIPTLLICQQYEQCRQQFQAMRAQLELKRDECLQTQKTEYDQKLSELVAVQRAELQALQQKHTNERNTLKETYEQAD